jgi:hypothetical protein
MPAVTDSNGYFRGYAYGLDFTDWRQPAVLLAETFMFYGGPGTRAFVWRNSMTGSPAPHSLCENWFSNVYYNGTDCFGPAYVVAGERLVPGIACFLAPPYPTLGEYVRKPYAVTTGGGAPLDAITYQSTGIGPPSLPGGNRVCTNVTLTALLNAVEVTTIGDPNIVVPGPPANVKGPLILSP